MSSLFCIINQKATEELIGTILVRSKDFLDCKVSFLHIDKKVKNNETVNYTFDPAKRRIKVKENDNAHTGQDFKVKLK